MEGSSRPPPPTRSRHQAAPHTAQSNPALIPTNQPQQLWQLAPVYHDGGYAINILQPYGWQQTPSGQGRPHQSSARKNKQRGRQKKRRHSNQQEADTGMPSLSSMRKENRAKARKYFGACGLGGALSTWCMQLHRQATVQPSSIGPTNHATHGASCAGKHNNLLDQRCAALLLLCCGGVVHTR